MSETYKNDIDSILINKNDSNNVGRHRKPPSSKGKKSRGPMNILKVALYMLRNRKGGFKAKRKSALPASTNTALNQIIGSVGPLYLQSSVGGMSPPPPYPPSQPLLTMPSPDRGVEGVVVMSPDRFEASPSHPAYTGCSSTTSRCSSSRSSSSVGGGMTSRYASAVSLYDLDNHDDGIEEGDVEGEMVDDDGDAYYDGIEGDDLIDAKAELFIAKFYQQMRLQD